MFQRLALRVLDKIELHSASFNQFLDSNILTEVGLRNKWNCGGSTNDVILHSQFHLTVTMNSSANSNCYVTEGKQSRINDRQ